MIKKISLKQKIAISNFSLIIRAFKIEIIIEIKIYGNLEELISNSTIQSIPFQ